MSVTALNKVKKKTYSPYQKKILALCFAAYVCAYLLRLNFSVANPALCDAMGFTTDKTGVISSGFLICYAIGQLVSGRLGDLIPTKIMLTVGLCVSVASNFIMGLSSNYYVMIAIWVVNGIFQSMLWSPIIKCLAQNFEGKRLISASFVMSLSCITGYILAWSMSALLRQFVSWRAIFIAPACISAVVIVCLFLFFKEDPSQYVSAVKAQKEKDAPRPSIFENKPILVAIVFTVLAAIFHGIVRESINSWLPTMIDDTGIFSAGATVLILILTPCLNFGGLMLTKKILSKCKSDSYKCANIISVISAVITILPPLLGFILSGQAYWLVLVGLTILIFALMSALNPLFISFMPLDYVKYDLVSTMTGVIDFAVYVGAAAASLFTGIIYGVSNSWTGVTLMWAVSMVLCYVMIVIAQRIINKRK